MFECFVTVFLPVCPAGTQKRMWLGVATYDFDPGLRPGDEVYVHNTTFDTLYSEPEHERIEGSGPKFSFQTIVLSRKSFLERRVSGDYFRLTIELEMADKELMPEIKKYLLETQPGQYEEYRPKPESDPDLDEIGD